MSFGFSNEEDDDFGSISINSNLASIFHDSGIHQSNSKSLVYTAPKQPQSTLTTTRSMSQVVIAAAAVTCYKLNNEKYEPLPGKIGLALLGENESKTYRIILYQNKQKPLASVRVTSEFTIISQPNNFCTFYDDHMQNWAILFDSKEVAQKFLGEIDQMKNVLAGHMNKSSSGEISSIDKIDGPLTNPIANETLSQDSNKTKLISRIAKLGQPILPISGAIVADDNSDSEQLMQSSSETEPLKERTKPRKAPRPGPGLTAQPSDRIDFNSSLNSMVVPSHQYAPLMSGQQPYPMMQFLPPAFTGNQGNSTHHFDTLMSENRMQSSEVRMHLCRLTDKIDLLLQKTGVLESHHKDSNNSSAVEPHLDALATDLQKLHVKSNEHSNKLNLILGEISASNKTIEKSINPTEAIDQLLSSERQAWLDSRKELEGIIQHLKQENDRMVHQIGEKSDREKERDARIQQLQEENARFKDDLETSNRNINDGTLNQLREENIRLTSLLDKTLLKETELASQCKKTQEKLEYYESRSNETDSRLLQFKSFAEDKERKLSDLQEYVQKLEKESSRARSLVETLQLQLKDAEAEIGNRSNRDEEQGPVEEKVKTIMNKVYKEITKKFKPDESYTFHTIKSTVSVVIRDITLAVLNKEPTVEPTFVSQAMSEDADHSITAMMDEVADTVVQGDYGSVLTEENVSIREEIVVTIQSENESKERSVSFLETLHSTLAAASLHNEHGTTWKPDPPPPPLFDDFDNEDDWLA